MKEVKIKLDEKSIEILSEIDSIHRESLINFGIRLAKNTEYFKILKGSEDVEDAISNISDTQEKTKINEEKPKKEKESTNSIDLSDLGF